MAAAAAAAAVLCARDRSKKKKIRLPLVKLRRRRLECFFGSNRFYLTPTKRGKGVPLPSTEHNHRPVLNVPYFLTSSADFKFLRNSRCKTSTEVYIHRLHYLPVLVQSSVRALSFPPGPAVLKNKQENRLIWFQWFACVYSQISVLNTAKGRGG